MWTLTSFCGWFDIISIATGADWGSPRPAEVRRQSGRPRTVPGQSPLPGKVLVGVYGPRRASSAWRGAPPPVVGPGGLPRASAVRGGRPLSVAGCCCLSWACCCCCCWLLAAAAAAVGGGVPRNHGNKCASSSPDQKSLRRACSSGMGGGTAPDQAHPRRVTGTQSQTRSTHKAYPSGTYTKQIWKRQNRTFTIRFAHHNALFEHEGNHITSLSACVLGTLVAGWLAKNSSALRAKNKHCFISNIWNYYPGNMRL